MHVDVLNRNGFSAYVLHQDENFRYPWRPNNTPLAYFEYDFWGSTFREKIHLLRIKEKRVLGWEMLLKNTHIFTTNPDGLKKCLPKFCSEDVIVIPDYLSYYFKPYFNDIPTVLLNFTAYFIYHSLTLKDVLQNSGRIDYHRGENILGSLVCSQDSQEYLKYSFQSLPVYVCQCCIDLEQFTYTPQKKKQIAFMPRKCEDHLVQILCMLKQRGHLDNWNLVPLTGMPQEELVQTLQDSAIYLSTSYQEGFGLPPAEAMACGAVVIGYHGEGGKEYIKAPYAYPIEHGNILAYVKKVEELANLFETGPEDFISIGKSASDYIHKTYPIQKEENSIVESWKELKEIFFQKESLKVPFCI
ncbi:MAG: glycosyltransferase [Parachlamydiales bacterium]|jgi:glycosyltransferase involved in cell wall biosynthesis